MADDLGGSEMEIVRNGFRSTVEDTELTVYPYEEDGVRVYPCIILGHTQPINYLSGAIGANDMNFRLIGVLYVRHNRNVEAGKMMDQYLSPTGARSIRAKLKANFDMGGTVTHAEWIVNGEVEHDRDDLERHWELSAEFAVQIVKNVR